MSLIMGLHLLERIYLISDTRLSYMDGRKPEDDLVKLFKVNNRISAVAAGNALPASYILNKLKEFVNEDTTIHEFRDIITNNLRRLITEYVERTTYHTGKVAYIIGGFNDGTVKKIEASKLGKAMSGELKKMEGKMVYQGIDKRIIASMGQLSGKGKGDYIRVDGVRSAELFSVDFDISTAKISESKEAECYDYLIFHPNQALVLVELPDEITGFIEFRERLQGITERTLYEDAEKLMSFANKVIKSNDFSSVGGHILIFIQTPEGAIFPTGDIATMREGEIVKLGGIFVRENRLCYELKDGTKGEYRHLEEISKNHLGKQDKDSMLI